MYEDKTVAIVGFGAEGQAALRYFVERGASVTVLDEDEAKSELVPDNIPFRSGPEAFSNLEEFDIVSRTAGVSPSKLHGAREITSVTKEFFKLCPAEIIGVTGTKGKGTTASLITEILKRDGFKVHLLGNIGTPALELIDDIEASDIVVYELSSFQLWDLDRSPHIAVVLMIGEEHMDVHQDMNEYVDAKANITVFQETNDIVIYHPTNSYSQQIAEQSIGKHLKYMTPGGAYLDDGVVMIDSKEIIKTNEVGIIGPHNLENICAAATAAWVYSQNLEAFGQAIGEFKGLEHRLEFVTKVNEVDYYDDSIGTTPESTIAAVRSFDQPKVLILGGSSKGANFDEMAQVIKSSEMRAVITLGDEGPRIAKALHGVGFDEQKMYDDVADMKAVVALATKLAEPGDVVILSPACASFDMFDNYKDRGDQYKKLLREL